MCLIRLPRVHSRPLVSTPCGKPLIRSRFLEILDMGRLHGKTVLKNHGSTYYSKNYTYISIFVYIDLILYKRCFYNPLGNVKLKMRELRQNDSG